MGNPPDHIIQSAANIVGKVQKFKKIFWVTCQKSPLQHSQHCRFPGGEDQGGDG